MKLWGDRRKPSLYNLTSLLCIIISFMLSVGSLISYYRNKAELAEKYNSKLKADYTKLWNQRNREINDRFDTIQEYLLSIQGNNIERIDVLEDRLKALEYSSKK